MNGLPTIDNRFPVHKVPQVRIEASEFFLNLKECLGIGNGSIHFQTVTNDPGVLQKLIQLFLIIPGHFLRIKIVIYLDVPFPFFENRKPAQACLNPVQYDLLK